MMLFTFEALEMFVIKIIRLLISNAMIGRPIYISVGYLKLRLQLLIKHRIAGGGFIMAVA